MNRTRLELSPPPWSRRLLLALGVFLSLGTVACGSGEEEDLLVFAAASLVNVMADIEREFEASSDGRVSVSFGGSQTLAQQIRRGAPADIFISAGPFQTSELAAEGLVEGEEVEVLYNRLVLLVRPGVELKSIQELANESIGRVGIADPALAPAGRYAQESLTTLGLWESIQDKLITAIDVRATMAYVESGNVDVSIVYKTDAAIAKDAIVLDLVPLDSYSRVVYPAVVINRPHRSTLAESFMDFLTGQTAADLFRRYGFEPATQ
ncbi:MAG: molybdate ABC transporter substrate-binding protein [Chloroflexi bacterium]|nr:molybdate ABC transporter substrate-binding protein [Chloroflexota bacterium]